MTSPSNLRQTSPRGRERRRLLLAAASELAMEQGFAAVSHRTVARRANLPLSATTYYFASLEDLLQQVLDDLADTWLVAAREAVASLPGQLDEPGELASAIVHVAVLAPARYDTDTLGVESVLTSYERYLEAARHLHLRPTIVQYDEQLDQLIAEVLRRGGLDHSSATARLVLAVVDGALLRALAEGVPVASASAPLRHLLGTLDQARSTPTI